DLDLAPVIRQGHRLEVVVDDLEIGGLVPHLDFVTHQGPGIAPHRDGAGCVRHVIASFRNPTVSRSFRRPARRRLLPGPGGPPPRPRPARPARPTTTAAAAAVGRRPGRGPPGRPAPPAPGRPPGPCPG